MWDPLPHPFYYLRLAIYLFSANTHTLLPMHYLIRESQTFADNPGLFDAGTSTTIVVQVNTCERFWCNYINVLTCL